MYLVRKQAEQKILSLVTMKETSDTRVAMRVVCHGKQSDSIKFRHSSYSYDDWLYPLSFFNVYTR